VRLPALLVLLLAVAAAAGPDRAEVSAKITYLVPEGAYVDAGSDQGLAAGDSGTVLRDGKPVAKAEILAVAGRSAHVRVFGGEARLGDLVQFEAVAPEPPPQETPKQPEAAEPFVPLLERQKAPVRVPSPRNVSHGWVSLQQYIQTNSFDDFYRTTLSSAGDIQRLWGKPWAFDWSFSLSGRGGDAFRDSVLEGVRLDVYELALSRRVGDEGLLRLGRFVPTALPQVGYLDGALFEQRLSPHVRGGVMAGLLPTIDELAPSLDAPAGVLYGTLDLGDRRSNRFTGSLGVLGALFDGDTDRFAVLLDTFTRVGVFDLSADAVVDFDVGAQQFTSGTRLTETNVDATLRVASGTTLRGGTDYYENLDNAWSRAGQPYVDPLVFEGSGWRYYAGVTQALPARLTLDLQFDWINAPDTGDTTNWNAMLTKYGVFGSDVASVSLSVYSLEGFDVGGLGGRISAYVPLGKVTLQGGVGFTAFDPEVATEFDVTDVNFLASWTLSRHWTLNGGVTAAIGDSADFVGIDLGLQYRW
jgi:hypothetical protein